MLRPPKKKKLFATNQHEYNEKLCRNVNSQERHPFQALNQRFEEVSFAKSIFEERVTNVTGALENDRASQPDLETVEVKSVDVVAPAKQEIVYQGKSGSGSESV
jgi:ABC-type microcin C transport system duplicated ATPase subunit YejF